ncbi:helix-turn-helix domain-containing protein [Rhizobiales bacterium 3FA27D7]|jgi:transcriptional regulator with XRE-family HTH domain|uniref:helix-turn-helix domain-containing protein n=1 Tax=Mesorhizobium sp. 2RAF21 TaxID=3232995 RepID=UPI0010F7DF74|nr:helix-turn-helix domain-containing protein [Dolichospermum sp. ST_sed6]
MKLSEYLSVNNLTDEAFGVLVGMSQSQISRIKRGISKPSWESLATIDHVTKGSVTANDFVPAVAPASGEAA